MRRRVEIIGHRGAPRAFPENTLSSFARALDEGVDAIELDVHATRDGVVVVRHDPDILPDWAAGGPGPPSIEIRSLRHDELRAIHGGADIPTLDDVLKLVAGRARAYVEIKAPAIEDLVVACIRRVGCDGVVHSFDHRVARRAKSLAGDLASGILLSSYLIDSAAALRAADARDLWQQWEFVDEPLVQQIHAAGGRVIAWTVNDRSAAERLVAAGVDGLCTDVPGLLTFLRGAS